MDQTLQSSLTGTVITMPLRVDDSAERHEWARDMRKRMTSGDHGIDMILGKPGHISFRWKIEAWKAFEGECK